MIVREGGKDEVRVGVSSDDDEIISTKPRTAVEPVPSKMDLGTRRLTWLSSFNGLTHYFIPIPIILRLGLFMGCLIAHGELYSYNQ